MVSTFLEDQGRSALTPGSSLLLVKDSPARARRKCPHAYLGRLYRQNALLAQRMPPILSRNAASAPGRVAGPGGDGIDRRLFMMPSPGMEHPYAGERDLAAGRCPGRFGRDRYCVQCGPGWFPGGVPTGERDAPGQHSAGYSGRGRHVPPGHPRRGHSQCSGRPAGGARHRLPGAGGGRVGGHRGGVPRARAVRAAQRQRGPRGGCGGAGQGRAGHHGPRTPAPARRLQRGVQAVRGRGRLRAGGTRHRGPAPGPGQPGDRPLRSGPDRGLGRQRARTGRGRVQRPAEPAAPRLRGPPDQRGGRSGPVGRHPGRRRVGRPQRRRPGLLRRSALRGEHLRDARGPRGGAGRPGSADRDGTGHQPPYAGGPLTAAVPGQNRPASQFLTGWIRDFFTVLAAPSS